MIGDRGPLFLRQNLRFPPIPPPLPPGMPRPGNNPGALAGDPSPRLSRRSVASRSPTISIPGPSTACGSAFNYYDGVNSGINNELGAPIKNMQVYNETFGFEKTFLDQQASIGFRLPVNTLTITQRLPRPGRHPHVDWATSARSSSTLVYDDPGATCSRSGLDMSYPTGPKTFAGYPTILGINPFEIQPFFGYILQGRQDVTSRDSTRSPSPPTAGLATMYYCDIGLGYFLYRSSDPRAILSAIVPTFETHLNIPLNWVGFQPQYIGGTPNVVDLTFGLNIGISDRAVLSLAYVRPVTGPLPFSGEFAMFLNIPFGQGRPEHPPDATRDRPMSDPSDDRPVAEPGVSLSHDVCRG